MSFIIVYVKKYINCMVISNVNVYDDKLHHSVNSFTIYASMLKLSIAIHNEFGEFRLFCLGSPVNQHSQI